MDAEELRALKAEEAYYARDVEQAKASLEAAQDKVHSAQNDLSAAKDSVVNAKESLSAANENLKKAKAKVADANANEDVEPKPDPSAESVGAGDAHTPQIKIREN